MENEADFFPYFGILMLIVPEVFTNKKIIFGRPNDIKTVFHSTNVQHL